MIIVPKEKPIVHRLNSYYLKVPKLIEHFQGELGSGVAHFKSATAEGVIVFDKDDLLNGVYNGKQTKLAGAEAVDALLHIDENASFSISVYGIKAEEIYYWSIIPNAKRIYQDLSTEFTDLEGLIKKMGNEELTGTIEVIIGDGSEGALLIMNAGGIVGGSYSWADRANAGQSDHQDILIQKTKAQGGIFHVSRLPSKGEAPVGDAAPSDSGGVVSPRVLNSLEELLGIMERIVQGRKGIQGGFQTALNRKFVEKADQYPFLDPFAGEFKYAHRKISLFADVGEREIWNGLMESVSDLSRELGLKLVLHENLVGWKKKYRKELNALGDALL